jgi:hypothetical protein
VGGLIGTATTEKNGLMSNTDKATGLWKYKAFNYSLYEIAKEKSDWQRSYAFLKGAIEGKPIDIIVGYIRKSSGIIETDIKYNCEKNEFIKFYKKESSVFVYFNLNSEAPNYLHISSKNSVILISEGKQPSSDYILLD